MRRVFFNAWSKYQQSLPLEGAEKLLIETILLHPEYHAVLDDPDTHLDRDYPPEAGTENPFLHMSLHVTIAEQLAMNNPAGIKEKLASLEQKMERHDALHVLLECLAEAVWQAQRHQAADLEQSYLDCIAERVRQ